MSPEYTLGQGTEVLHADAAVLIACSFLYIMAANATSVDVLALTGPGKAKKISSLDISGPARAAGVPIGEYQYVLVLRSNLAR